MQFTEYNDRALNEALRIIGGNDMVTVVHILYGVISRAERLGYEEGQQHAAEGVGEAYYDQADADATATSLEDSGREWDDGYLDGVRDARVDMAQTLSDLLEMEEVSYWSQGYRDGVEDVREKASYTDSIVNGILESREDADDALADEADFDTARAALALDETLA